MTLHKISYTAAVVISRARGSHAFLRPGGGVLGEVCFVGVKVYVGAR